MNMKFREISTIDWDTIPVVRSTLLNDKAIKLSTAKVYTFSDAVLCLGGRIEEYPQSAVSWKTRIGWFTQSSQYRELDNIDGEPVVFEWTKISQAHHAEATLGGLKHDGRNNSARKVPRSSHLHVDVQRHWLGTQWQRRKFSTEFLKCGCIRLKGHWTFLGLGSEENLRYACSQTKRFVQQSRERCLVFRGTSAFFRGTLRNKGGGRTLTQFFAEPAAAELSLRSIISVNQLSVCEAVAGWCQELAQRIAAPSAFRTENPVAKVNKDPESQVASADVSNLSKSPMFSMGARGNSGENLSEDFRVREACDDAGFIRTVSPGQFFVTIHDIQLAGFGCTSSCRELRFQRR